MLVNMLKSKIHRAVVTESDIDYEGSIGIDQDFITKTGLLINEQVDVLDITNGERLTTYVIPEPAGSKKISINGAAAHKVKVGDLIIICAYGAMEYEHAQLFKPRLLLLERNNDIQREINCIEEYAYA